MTLYGLDRFHISHIFGYGQFLLVSNHMSRGLEHLNEPGMVDLRQRFKGNMDEESFHTLVQDSVNRLGGKIVLFNGGDVIIGGAPDVLDEIERDIGERFTYDMFDRNQLASYVEMMKGLHEKYGQADAETFFGRRFGDAPHLDS